MTSEFSGDSAQQMVQTFIQTRLPLADQLLMRRFENARTRGLIATRQGNLIAAERAFAVAHTPLQLGKLSSEGNLLYQSLLEQAEAYLDYRRGDFDQARNRTFEAIRIDVVLEEKYGYDFLLLHRIQLVHNLVRIDARCLWFDRAIGLACQILNYLEGALEALPILGSWDYERVARQSPKLVAAMFAQVTNELALILAGKNRQLDRDLFEVTSTHLHLPTNSNCHCHPRAYAWLLIKQAFINNDVVTFLERASHFLSEGRSDTPLLWYATVIDLISLCNELDIPESELVRQEVAREAVTWEYCPQKLLPLLGVCSKTERA
ncbi:hypothetical protein [Brasilonema sp. UFV-L1]|uniref:hypothetical protein n=1 Tax=Brasilonema sp. UFV-L1 TaxID=2234130 RepID=UPI00145D6A3B|nr:hypothetical protein [Brasilonema sp. UFV-L1]NMG07812.1 hypothetical protein [Brasilonema sp. UFV-L1]